MMSVRSSSNSEYATNSDYKSRDSAPKAVFVSLQGILQAVLRLVTQQEELNGVMLFRFLN
jgi:hypothetical protein